MSLPLRRSGYSVDVRPGTCDVITYYDVVVRELYGRMPIDSVATVIDCGANIGMASAYMLSRFPSSHVWAIEPDPTNFDLCARNLEQFGERAHLLRAAICGHSQPVKAALTLAGTWASTVVSTTTDDPGAFEGIGMDDLLTRLGLPRVDLLKIDIEGAEVDVFSSGPLHWLDRIGCIEVELESRAAEEFFFGALSRRGFTFSRFGDIVIASRHNERAGKLSDGDRLRRSTPPMAREHSANHRADGEPTRGDRV